MPDDFYVTPLDWGAANRVAVALQSGVHIWDANTATAHCLSDATSSTSSGDISSDHVCSVAWRRGVHTEQLAEGLQAGVVRVRDAETRAVVAAVAAHRRRVGVCAWGPRGVLLATGSKDRAVALVDVRAGRGAAVAAGAAAHRQEVCGLRWAPDGVLLASVLGCMAGATLFNISAQTFIQQQTPDHLIGKVMSFVSVIAVCTLPIGQAMYGFLFEAFKERIFLVVLFAAVMGLVIALAVRHILRRVPSPQAMD